MTVPGVGLFPKGDAHGAKSDIFLRLGKVEVLGKSVIVNVTKQSQNFYRTLMVNNNKSSS